MLNLIKKEKESKGNYFMSLMFRKNKAKKNSF